MPGLVMQVYLTTMGCRLNEAEIESWSRGFRQRGHHVVTTPHEAQVMVVNTCAVTADAARTSRKLVSGLHRDNPSAQLVVTGCFAELEPERAAALAGVDMVVGNRDKERLVSLVSERFAVPAMPVLATEPEGTHVYQQRGRTRAFIKVQDGCRNRCTFCIVTIARGQERSRTIAEVVDEIRELARAGYREAVLTGVHLGGYGSDLGTDLAALVRAILDHTDIARLRLSSLEPWDVPAHLFALWRDPRLMPHLHLPLQSGSDAVLRRMARRSSTRSFAELVARARAAIADLTLTTDVIVGFPGETQAEWAETMDFVRSMGFGHMHIFPYSPREGTRAARLPGQVASAIKRERSRELHALAADMKAAHLVRFVGQVRQVLWEGKGEVVASPTGGRRHYTGYTDNYLSVETLVPEGQCLKNRITGARLVAVAGRPGAHLVAELTD